MSKWSGPLTRGTVPVGPNLTKIQIDHQNLTLGREKGPMVTKGMLQTHSAVRYAALIYQNVLSSTVCGTV